MNPQRRRPVTAMQLINVIQELQRLLDADREHPHWRWQLRQQLAAVREELASDRIRSFDGWLTAKASATDRTRRQLMGRLSAVMAQDFDNPDTAWLVANRLLQDLEHFRQRVTDLSYDAVSMEIGGSE